MLKYTFAGLEHQIQTVKRAITLLELFDDTKTLKIVFETTIRFHASIQRILSGMTERRMPQIVRQRNGLDQVFIQLQVTRE